MNQLINLFKLSSASFFDKETLQRVVGVSDNALYANIKRWLRKGDLIQLKKGLYVTNTYYQPVANKQAYFEFIANILKQPSYLSGEYILQKHSMLTESVFTTTCVTLKKTRTYQNKFGTFVYSNIKEELFTGFKIVTKDRFEIKESTRAKALFDFLYFRLRKLPEISKEYIKSFRLNLEEMQEQEFEEFDFYVTLSGLEKLAGLSSILKEIADDR